MARLYSFARYLAEEQGIKAPAINSADEARVKLKDLWNKYGDLYMDEAQSEDRDFEDYSGLWS